jgi:hypothetical protein
MKFAIIKLLFFLEEKIMLRTQLDVMLLSSQMRASRPNLKQEIPQKQNMKREVMNKWRQVPLSLKCSILVNHYSQEMCIIPKQP